MKKILIVIIIPVIIVIGIGIGKINNLTLDVNNYMSIEIIRNAWGEEFTKEMDEYLSNMNLETSIQDALNQNYEIMGLLLKDMNFIERVNFYITTKKSQKSIIDSMDVDSMNQIVDESLNYYNSLSDNEKIEYQNLFKQSLTEGVE